MERKGTHVSFMFQQEGVYTHRSEQILLLQIFSLCEVAPHLKRVYIFAMFFFPFSDNKYSTGLLCCACATFVLANDARKCLSVKKKKKC